MIIADAAQTEEVTRVAVDTEGVASAAPVTAAGRTGTGAPLVVDGRVPIDATLAAAADSDATKETVRRLRDRVHAVPGADAPVGGYTAQQYDTQRTSERDRAVIVPVVLGIILLVLAPLLRSLLVPLLLVATVALNSFATLGVSALVFENLLGFSGTDASVPLYGFVFLVALGVDYNIFLMSRVREESLTHGTRQGILRGLTTTGGVITSAGVVLAATFATLTVIPPAFLVQLAFIVAFGVLLAPWSSAPCWYPRWSSTSVPAPGGPALWHALPVPTRHRSCTPPDEGRVTRGTLRPCHPGHAPAVPPVTVRATRAGLPRVAGPVSPSGWQR